jgi:hypothetical protein
VITGYDGTRFITEEEIRENAHRQYINAELDKSVLEAGNPNTKRLSHGEVMANLKKQREVRKHI